MGKEKHKHKAIKDNGTYFLKKVKELNDSVKEQLAPAYRKQYNIRRFISCILLFFLLRFWKDATYYFSFGESIIGIGSIFPMIYSIIAWKFWHYAYWSFRGGVIDNLSKSIIHIGSIWAVLGKIILQNFIILIWIALIAPFSGIKTWLKAVKHDKVLFFGNEKW